VDVPLWAWLAVTAVIAGMLSLDLFVLHRRAHEVSVKEAAVTSAGWVAFGVAFGGLLWAVAGGEVAGEYYAGYLIEKSLSVDNIFVFAMLLGWFAVPAVHQHRVLFWGVVGALVLRAGFIAVGVELLETFHWAIYIFGAFLVFTGVKMVRHGAGNVRPDRNPVVRLLRRIMPVTDVIDGPRFFVRRAGGHGRKAVAATPLFAALVAIETSDVVFAVDSIPAIFAVTDDAFVVFTSNAFAILGLRALYFLLAGLVTRFRYLKYGLAAILVFVGAKMLAIDVLHVPVGVSLAVIAGVLAVAVGASWRQPADVLGVPSPAAEQLRHANGGQADRRHHQQPHQQVEGQVGARPDA
jgi:tellurite resistance protein TerC